MCVFSSDPFVVSEREKELKSLEYFGVQLKLLLCTLLHFNLFFSPVNRPFSATSWFSCVLSVLFGSRMFVAPRPQR